jgi:hypothetical protein
MLVKPWTSYQAQGPMLWLFSFSCDTHHDKNEKNCGAFKKMECMLVAGVLLF